MSVVNPMPRSEDACDLAPGYIRAIAPYQPGKPISFKLEVRDEEDG